MLGRRSFFTGLSICIPEGYYARIAPRSSLAIQYGIQVLAGVIDSSYRGEIIIVLINLSQHTVSGSFDQKIAQLIIEKIHTGTPRLVESFGSLEITERGTGGFGSSGK